MIIRCCLFLIAFTGTFPDVRAQQLSNPDSHTVINPADFFRILRPLEEVEGRVNLFKAWEQGDVFLSQGRFASDITFNYDVLNNALLVLIDEKEFTLNPIAVDSIIMAGSSQVLVNPIILERVDGELLLLRVYEGIHLSLFRNTLAKVNDRDTNTAAISEFKSSPDNEIQIDQEQMYLLLNKATNEVIEFQGKKKELRNWENGDQVLAFVKDQKLDLKKETDLIQVVQYYERLTFGVH